MRKPVCLITGATEGIGKATALHLAKWGFEVVLTGRSADKAASVRREIVELTGNPDVSYIAADLRSLTQVHALVETFKERYLGLDVLINNAGAVMPSRTVTEDGFEATFQVNYLSHFVLTQLLLDELKKSEQGRIVNLASSAYVMGSFDVANLQSERRFSPIGAYASAKLFVLMSTIELAKRLRDTSVVVNAVHPGTARTQMMTRAPGLLRLVGYLAYPFAASADRSARAPLHLATSLDASDVSGAYFVGDRPRPIASNFNTPENRALLWSASMECLPTPGGRDDRG